MVKTLVMNRALCNVLIASMKTDLRSHKVFLHFWQELLRHVTMHG